MSRRLQKPRAERFALTLPARVRPQGHATWRDADVVNVSRSGILLAVSASFPPAETLDLVFGLTDSAARTADVRCVAHVVRETRDAKGRSLLAATLDQYILEAPTDACDVRLRWTSRPVAPHRRSKAAALALAR